MNEPLLTIAACTFKRPEGIRACLESLLTQQTDVPFRVVVVENEPSQMAREVVESFIPQFAQRGVELCYFCEPESNISIARNRCVKEATGEFILFIDDDEWAEPDWIQNMVEVQRETAADVVWGNVKFEFPEGFPKSSQKISFYRFEFTAQDVAPHSSFATNTTLMKLEQLRERKKPDEPGPFNPEYGKTGSEDGDLCMYYMTHGRKIFRTSRAVVHEMQPLKRGRFWFFIERKIRESSCLAKLARSHFGFINSKRYMLRMTAIAFWQGLCELPGLLIHPRQSLIDIGCCAAVPLGYICYFLGLRWKGY